MTAFETERLRARAWTMDAADVDASFAMFGDARVMRFIGDGSTWPDRAAAVDRMRDVLKRNSHLRAGLGSWALEEKSTGNVIGSLVLKPIPPALAEVEVGWHLNHAAWGQGYAPEMARILVEHGLRTLHLEDVIAVVQPPNTRSLAVARKIGMKHMGQTTRFYNGTTLEWFRITTADL